MFVRKKARQEEPEEESTEQPGFLTAVPGRPRPSAVGSRRLLLVAMPGAPSPSSFLLRSKDERRSL